MTINVVGGWNMKLHGNFVVCEKQMLHMFQFGPVRTAVGTADAHVVPSLTRRCDNAHRGLVDWRRHEECSAGFIANISKICNALWRHIPINIKEMQIFHVFSHAAITLAIDTFFRRAIAICHLAGSTSSVVQLCMAPGFAPSSKPILNMSVLFMAVL